MTRKSLFSLVFSLLLLSLACNLPFGSSDGDAIPEDELSGALNLMRGYDTYFGVMETIRHQRKRLPRCALLHPAGGGESLKEFTCSNFIPWKIRMTAVTAPG